MRQTLRTFSFENTVVFCLTALSLSFGMADDNRSPTVGMSGRIEQIKLPGTELRGRPLDDDKIPVVARIDRTPLAYDGGFQYDIVFYGVRPGPFNLADFLVRIDGSSTDDLPEIPIEIRSLLPEGSNQPNELSNRWLPSLGGYKFLMILALIGWTAILVAMIFVGRRKSTDQTVAARQLSLADYLQPRLEAAMNGEMEPRGYAELERMLAAFWRRKLDLEQIEPATAIKRLREHEQAGPLLGQLEQWMHNPQADKSIDLVQLLEPYRKISLKEIETMDQQQESSAT